MSGLFYAVKSSVSKKNKNNCSKVLLINKSLLYLYSRNKTKKRL